MSVNPDETAYEPSRQDCHCLLTIIVNLLFIPILEILNTQGRCPNLVVRPNIPDFTLILINPTMFPRGLRNQIDIFISCIC